MHIGVKVVLNLVLVAATVAAMAVFLIGLPELVYVADSGDAWPGEHSIRLLEIVFSSGELDPIVCFEFAVDPACLRDELLDGTLFNRLSDESGAMLIRNFGWLLYCGLVYVVLRAASFSRTWLGLMSEVAEAFLWWVPTIHVFWLSIALAGAYVVSLL
ncbi:hypothetical protein [Devosia sp.]|uniref:hypothetical protein n=1 Tax=Devosia sp. TaxID=1871048 RepID=UPI00326360A0